jgi:hypothetical protein
MVPNPISDIGMFSPSLVLRYGREEEEEEEEEEDSRDALVLPPLLRLPPRIDDGVVAGIERAAARAGGDMRDALCAGCFRGFARVNVKNARTGNSKQKERSCYRSRKTRCPPSGNNQNNRNNNNNNERCVAKSSARGRF